MTDKVKGVSFAQVKAKAFKNPEVLEAYLAEQRKAAGINSAKVATRMGVKKKGA